MIPSHTMSAASFHFTHPPSYLLQFPPSNDPQTLKPPLSDRSFSRPFDIDPELYQHALLPVVPISIAVIYGTTVIIINRVNKARGHKPWAFSKSSAFYAFVLAHNVFLALYSAWTFMGMINAYRQSWPGWKGEYGLAGAIDSLCKIHGPRGFGSAATYSHAGNKWEVTDRSIALLGGLPDASDVGRIWNEGLAFYGWLFYISKFYEVVDTFIVLAKGKKSSFLQTYHHTGAMMCMWAGIRYMSPPIWMFVLINSGLHSVMYTYYTMSTLGKRVPQILKQTLTSLQIIQFVFGGSYAVAHLFITYKIPVSTPYRFIHNLSSALPAAASSVSSVVSSATASAGVADWIKKAALRAAGEEGLAENVRNQAGEAFGIDAIHAAQLEKAQEEIRYSLKYQSITCLDTSGQTFAILLNALYLAPLTCLFIHFFVNSYLRRTKAAPPPVDHKQIAKDSSHDALSFLEQEIREAMEDEQTANETDIPPAVKAKLDEARANLRKSIDEVNEKAKLAKKLTEEVFQTRRNQKPRTTEANDLSKRPEDVSTNKAEQSTTDEHDGASPPNDISNSPTEPPHSSDEPSQTSESMYEVNPDELLDPQEKKAETELQPGGP